MLWPVLDAVRHTAAANLLLFGAAYQAGALPIPAAAIDEAIELNGVAIEANKAAFAWVRGRRGTEAFATATVRPTTATRSDSLLPAELAAAITMSGDTAEAVIRRRA